jgi:serine/threonine protein kinase
MEPHRPADPRDVIPRVKHNELKMRGRNNKKLRTGAGGFSSVYAGVYTPRGGQTTLVAVKYYKQRVMKTDEDIDRFFEEALGHHRLSLLGRAHGCNIVPFFGVLEHSNQRRVKRAIVMQRMRCSLADLIRTGGAGAQARCRRSRS